LKNHNWLKVTNLEYFTALDCFVTLCNNVWTFKKSGELQNQMNDTINFTPQVWLTNGHILQKVIPNLI
jgi:hypothetical protein